MIPRACVTPLWGGRHGRGQTAGARAGKAQADSATPLSPRASAMAPGGAGGVGGAGWSSPGADLSEALSALWPQLELGFSMIPGRPCDRLPSWRASFLAIKPTKQDYDSDSGGSRAGSRASNEPGSPFFAADSYVVGLV